MRNAYLLAIVASTLIASAMQADTAESEFQQIDKNKDGVIDKTEWAAYAASKVEAKPIARENDSSDSAVQTQPVTTATPPSKSLAKRIGEQITVRKTFLSEAKDDPDSILPTDEGEPARFSWTHSRGEASFYTLDFAVLWHPTVNHKPILDWQHEGSDFLLAWYVQPVFEAHVSNEAKAEQNSLTYRIPFTLTLSPATHANMPGLGDVLLPSRDAFIKGHEIIASPVYETDRTNKVQTLGGDIYYTPTVIPALAVGKEAALGPVTFRWRPYVGFEGGHIRDDRNNPMLGDQSGYARFAMKLHAELWIDIFAPDQFVLTADYFLRRDFAGDNLTHNFWEISPTLYLDKDHALSTGLSWKRGSTPPTFEKVDSFVIWVGAKF